MEEIFLSAERRVLTGKKVKQLRLEGFVPAIVYGRTTETAAVTIPIRQLSDAIGLAGGSRLIKLGLAGETKNVLVREVQRDVLTREIIHADFYEVVMTEKITANIPLTLVGVAPAVATGLGLLVHGLTSVEVECLPGDLVNEITADISGLVDVQSRISVSDLAIPAGMTLLTDVDEMVATITTMRAEEVEEVEEELEFEGEEGFGEEAGEVVTDTDSEDE